MKLMIVDDHAGVRDMIRQLASKPGDALCECSSGDEAVRVAPEFKPDFVTMDIRMPGMCSFTAARMIRQAHPDAQIVIVSSYDQPDLRRAAEEAGALGYVVKENLSVLPEMIGRNARPGTRETHARPAPRQRKRQVPVRWQEDTVFRARQAELDLRQEQHLRSLIENASDLITVVNPKGTIRFQSPSSRRILDTAPEDMTGQSLFDLLHPDDVRKAEGAIQTMIRTAGIPQTLEFRMKTHGGDWRLVECIGRSVEEPGGEGYLILNGRDITETTRLEEQLRQAQKMEAVGQLAGGIAHDFNNILAATLMHLGLLRSDFRLPGEMIESLQELEKGVKRAANLTRQLLLFSRRELMQVQPIELNELLEDMTKMLSRLLGENIEIRLQTPHPSPLINADKGMIEQVVMNLCINARDAMPRGGRLVIATKLVEITAADAAKNRDARAGTFVRLSVSDTGSGMDAATLGRIFEPFFTTKPAGKGTGLGLATVFGIVKQHKGWIQVQSAVDEGSTFWIYLPATQKTQAQPLPPTPAPVQSGGHETILVVEDEIGVRRLIAMVLRQKGYRVIEAANGVEALQLWKQSPEPVSLLYTDMVMPEGLSGLDLAGQLRAQNPDIKIILSSGYSTELNDERKSIPGDMAFLTKPCSPELLAKTVRECLDKKS
ncbi:MAG: response regulator [Verrucomicrobiota bacterium]